MRNLNRTNLRFGDNEDLHGDLVVEREGVIDSFNELSIGADGTPVLLGVFVSQLKHKVLAETVNTGKHGCSEKGVCFQRRRQK